MLGGRQDGPVADRATFWCERAWLGGADPAVGVLVDVENDRFGSVRSDVAEHDAGPRAVRLRGLTVPGFANCHSHVFHRAIRGRTQRGHGTFWTWRAQMYALAERLDPDRYFRLARAAYREMAAAGITLVGEFHYLHHQPDGTPYGDPNAMGAALVAAAGEAGVRITLLDTCYLAAGIDSPPEGVQVRFSDGDAYRWASRAARVAPAPHLRAGAAIHSVRAVPHEQLATVAQVADQHGWPLHAHVSEQQAENEACLAAYGKTPVELLDDAGALGPRTSLVHVTHLGLDDVDRVGRSAAYSCFCPTTERDLGDGIGPSRELRQAGSRLTLGSDSHAVVDLVEEMRAVEMDERLRTEERGHWSAADLLTAATTDGHASLGWPEAGRIEPGAIADLVTVDLDSVRTAGTGRSLESLVFASTAADITQVVAGGQLVDASGIGTELSAAVGACHAT
jgi:formiminoglutamate deiminase